VWFVFSPEKTNRCALKKRQELEQPLMSFWISFIKIAGVLARGEGTGAILAVRINKRHAAGMELIALIMKKLCSRLSRTLSTENKSQILQKP